MPSRNNPRAAASAGADPEPPDTAHCPGCGHDWHLAIGVPASVGAQGGPSLDVERLAEALRNTYMARMADAHSAETEATIIAAEYARLSVGEPREVGESEGEGA